MWWYLSGPARPFLHRPVSLDEFRRSEMPSQLLEVDLTRNAAGGISSAARASGFSIVRHQPRESKEAAFSVF